MSSHGNLYKFVKYVMKTILRLKKISENKERQNYLNMLTYPRPNARFCLPYNERAKLNKYIQQNE